MNSKTKHEQLTHPMSGVNEDMSAYRMMRYPLVYEQSPVTDYNYARLPDESQWDDMAMTFREQSLSEDVRKKRLRFLFLASSILASVMTGLFVILQAFSQFAGFGQAVGGIVQMVVFAVAACGLIIFFKRKLTPLMIILIMFAPFLGVILTTLIEWVAFSRFFVGIASSFLTIMLFWKMGSRPFEFYRQWIKTAPWLTSKQIEDLSPKDESFTPQWVFLVVVFAIAALVPYLSPTIALVSVYVVVVAQILRFFPTTPDESIMEKLRVFTQQLTDILSSYLTHGMRAPLAPGVWKFDQSSASRSWYIILMLFGTYLTINTSLYQGVPWDLLQLLPNGDLTSEEFGQIRDNPYVWSVYFMEMVAVSDHGRFMPWFFIFPIIVQVTLPIGIMVAAFAPHIRKVKDFESEIEDLKNQDQRPEWQWYVDRIRSSKHEATDPLGAKVRERDHLFLGIEDQFGYPVYFDRKVLSEHTYIAGETGSGKTSMGILPILLQLIRGNESTDPENGNTVLSPVPPIVILDLKGDPALFHTVKAETEFRAVADAIARGVDPEDEEALNEIKKKAFGFFTPEKDRSSHVFNPFDNLDYGTHSIIQICNILMDSLSLNHGEGYGRGYYTSKNRLALASALAGDNKPSTFPELLKSVHKEAGKGGTKDLHELLSVINALMHYPQLGSGQGVPEDQVIRMSEVIEQRKVVYFYLPAATESISVREIAKLALFTFFNALVQRQRSGVDGATPRQCYVFIDEFQRIAGENFKIILEQARGFGLGAVLANQCQSDLKTPSTDLRPTIRTNTRTKLFFSLSDPKEIHDLSTTSGQEITGIQTSMSTEGTSDRSTYDSTVGTLKNRITINDILAVSDSPTGMIAQVSRGSGYTQFGGRPVMIRSTWPLSLDHYQYYASNGWPELEKGHQSDQSPNQVDQAARDEVEELLSRIDQEISIVFPDLDEG